MISKRFRIQSENQVQTYCSKYCIFQVCTITRLYCTFLCIKMRLKTDFSISKKFLVMTPQTPYERVPALSAHISSLRNVRPAASFLLATYYYPHTNGVDIQTAYTWFLSSTYTFISFEAASCTKIRSHFNVFHRHLQTSFITVVKT